MFSSTFDQYQSGISVCSFLIMCLSGFNNIIIALWNELEVSNICKSLRGTSIHFLLNDLQNSLVNCWSWGYFLESLGLPIQFRFPCDSMLLVRFLENIHFYQATQFFFSTQLLTVVFYAFLFLWNLEYSFLCFFLLFAPSHSI